MPLTKLPAPEPAPGGAPSASPAAPSATETGFTLVYRDDCLLVLDKPAGLLAVPGRGEDKQDCLALRVQRVFNDALVVHRLDMSTSGLMVMARGADMQRRLSLAFEARDVHKRYVAVVEGRPEPAQEEVQGWSQIDLPIAADWPRRPLRIIDAALGKASLTRWRLQPGADDPAAWPGASRVELEPVTGRTHQLRVHLQAIGHPILGDLLYAPAPTQARASRLLLHACALRLTHPVTGELLQLESPAPF